MRRNAPPETAVFLNVPFDRAYERTFVALIAGLCMLGCKPRCVLEIPATKDRLNRLFALIQECGISIHDLSRASGYPPRFNMPFELGLAAALGLQSNGDHRFFIMERVPYRVQKTLSDVNGYDTHIHNGSIAAVTAALLDFIESTRPVEPDGVVAVARALWAAARKMKADHRAETVFRPAIFRKLVVVGTELSEVALEAAGAKV